VPSYDSTFVYLSLLFIYVSHYCYR
jgi:hypothetical protein